MSAFEKIPLDSMSKSQLIACIAALREENEKLKANKVVLQASAAIDAKVYAMAKDLDAVKSDIKRDMVHRCCDELMKYVEFSEYRDRLHSHIISAKLIVVDVLNRKPELVRINGE